MYTPRHTHIHTYVHTTYLPINVHKYLLYTQTLENTVRHTYIHTYRNTPEYCGCTYMLLFVVSYIHIIRTSEKKKK